MNNKIFKKTVCLFISMLMLCTEISVNKAMATDDYMLKLNISNTKIADSVTNSEFIKSCGSIENKVMLINNVDIPYLGMNGALRFDDMSVMATNTNMTYSIWTKLSSETVGEGTIFRLTKNADSVNDTYTTSELVYDADNSKLIWKSARTIGNTAFIEKSIDIYSDEWVNIILTRCSNGTENNWWDSEIYINGELMTDKDGVPGMYPVELVPQSLIIGAATSNGDKICKNSMSSFSVYSTRMNESAAKSLYDSEKNTYLDGQLLETDVFYNTKEAMPDDIVMISGKGLDKIQSVGCVRLSDDAPQAPSFYEDIYPEKSYGKYMDYSNYQSCDITSWQQMNLIQSDETCLKFAVPNTYEYGVYAVKVGYRVMYINKPQIQWVQYMGDNKIRVCGKNLSLDSDKSQLAMIKSNGEITYLSPSVIYDNYSVEFELNGEIENGTFEIYAHNGYGGKHSWSEPYKFEFINQATANQTLYNVKDYGAKGDGVTNDSAAVRNALQSAQNGGIVYFPRGQYVFSNMLEIPKGVTIKGESRTLVSLVWIPFNWNINELPEAFLKGTSDFGICDISIRATRALCIIKGDSGTPTSGNIEISNVFIQANPFAGNHTISEYNKIMNEIENSSYMDAIHLGGNNIKITDCEVYSPSRPIGIGGCSNCVIRNNTFYTGFNGWYSISGGNGVIFEDNRIIGADMTSSGGGVNNLAYQVTQNIYFARNSFEKIGGKDREAVTTDGGRGAFYGKISSINGTTLIVDGTPEWSDAQWIGAGVFIADGTGAGQYRQIKSFDGDKIILNEPFELNPATEDSIISVSSLNRNGYYIGNTFTDTGHLQFYGMAIDSVIKNNEFTRSGGINTIGMNVYTAYQPNWYNYICENTIKEGNYTHWYGLDTYSGNAKIRTAANGDVPMNILTTIRRNTIENNGCIELFASGQTDCLKNCVVEHNNISLSDYGIKASGNIAGTVLYHNSFNNVLNEYKIDDVLLANGKLLK